MARKGPLTITLKAARVNAGLSRREVAEQLGIKQSRLESWENGRSDIPAESFLSLCRMYNVDDDDIRLS